MAAPRWEDGIEGHQMAPNRTPIDCPVTFIPFWFAYKSCFLFHSCS